MPEEDFPDFSLIPADYADVDPDAELAQLNALIDATGDLDALDPVTAEERLPLGRSWTFDLDAGRFVDNGGVPMVAYGTDAVIQWAQIALRTQRLTYPIFSEDFGMDAPDRLVGFIDSAERRAQLVADITDALEVHDRITRVRDFDFTTDTDEEVLLVTATIVIDDEVEAQVEAVPV